MNDSYNFDTVYDRRNCDATKYSELEEKYGRSDLLPLWIADMDFAVPEAVTRALDEAIHQPVLGYTTAPAGFYASIASWLSERHGWAVEPHEVDFMPGVKKAIGLCVNYFTCPGDKILIQPPVYHSFRSVVEGNGRVVVTNPLVEDAQGSYHMDIEALERTIEAERPVMMIVCNPHNPIGLQWDADTLRQVAAVCHRHGVLILSDEIYADLVLPGGRHVPTASVSAEAAEITVTLGAPSKSFNIPGIASAWTAVKSPALRDGFFAWLKASEFDTPPTCAIYATMAAYSECEDWLDAMLAYLRDNRDYAIDYIATHMPGVRTFTPEAGFGLWIDFRGLGLSHDELTEMLTGKARVAVSDGVSFGKEGSGLVRLNFGVPRSVLTEGLDRIKSAL
ncbi:MAG: PatB family C-S lyase [Muribaculaceae bacterium]|nr:PatB family C-S lyase [Muribaculaceae bacterium]